MNHNTKTIRHPRVTYSEAAGRGGSPGDTFRVLKDGEEKRGVPDAKAGAGGCRDKATTGR